MLYYKTREEIQLIRESARLVSQTLAALVPYIEPGATTQRFDQLAEEFIRDHGAEPSFKGYQEYPATLCTSVNQQVVHGIPNDTPLEEGDIVSIDCGVFMNGFHGDHAYTFVVGETTPENQQLVKVTKECLYKGVEQAIKGNRIGHIAHAIEQYANQHGYTAVRGLTGHGLGRYLHEAPKVPNYGSKHNGPVIKNGLVIAIEPMINMGKRDVYQQDDGWTEVAVDGLPSAHFEHNVAIVDGKAEILSDYSCIETALKKQGQSVFA